MDMGNSTYNLLFNSEEKHYENVADNIDLEDKNNSLTFIVSEVKEQATVLDVGCSYGYIGEWLIKNKKCKMYGIDLDEVALEELNKRSIYEDTFKMNLDSVDSNKDKEIKRFQNLDTQFDYIICADVLEHLKNPTELLKFLSQKLKYGGEVIVSVPNISNVDIIMSLMDEKFNYSRYGILDNTHVKFFTKKSFAEWIWAANKYFQDFNLDLNYKGPTRFKTELAVKYKKDVPYLYDLMVTNNSDLEIFQNIFTLTKIRKNDTCINLNKFLMDYRYNLVEVSGDIEANNVSEKITLESPFIYEVKLTNKGLKSIEILVATYNEIIKGNINLSIFKDEDKFPIFQSEYNALEFRDNSWVSLDVGIEENLKGSYIKIYITSNLDKDNNISLWLNSSKEPCMKLKCIDDFKYDSSEENYDSLRKIDSIIKSKINGEQYHEEKRRQFEQVTEANQEVISNLNSEIETLREEILQINSKIDEANTLILENEELKKMVKELILELS